MSDLPEDHPCSIWSAVAGLAAEVALAGAGMLLVAWIVRRLQYL